MSWKGGVYMIYLLFFALGFIADRYFLQIADLLLNAYANNKQLQATNVQFKIDKIANEKKLESADTQYELTLIQKDIGDIGLDNDSNVIGFDIKDCIDKNDLDYDDIEEEDVLHLKKSENL